MQVCGVATTLLNADNVHACEAYVQSFSGFRAMDAGHYVNMLQKEGTSAIIAKSIVVIQDKKNGI